MLILSRRTGESLVIEPDPTLANDPQSWFAEGPIRLRINSINGSHVRLGIDAPRALRVLREELVNGPGAQATGNLPPRALLARKVQLLRGLRKWSTQDLAEAAGLSLTVVVCIESATGHVELVELEALARAFGLTVAELFLPPGRTPEER